MNLHFYIELKRLNWIDKNIDNERKSFLRKKHLTPIMSFHHNPKCHRWISEIAVRLNGPPIVSCPLTSDLCDAAGSKSLTHLMVTHADVSSNDTILEWMATIKYHEIFGRMRVKNAIAPWGTARLHVRHSVFHLLTERIAATKSANKRLKVLIHLIQLYTQYVLIRLLIHLRWHSKYKSNQKSFLYIEIHKKYEHYKK